VGSEHVISEGRNQSWLDSEGSPADSANDDYTQAASGLTAIPLTGEAEFYRHYEWALNAFPTIENVVKHLRGELRRLEQVPPGWQSTEVINNVFLLACTISTAIDDYLVGTIYDFSKVSRVVPPAEPIVRMAEKVLRLPNKLRSMRLKWLYDWNCAWNRAITEFLQCSLATDVIDLISLPHKRDRLFGLLTTELPKEFAGKRPKIPAYFRSRDFTPHDSLELSRKFVEAFPDRARPILVVGFRTAGSYLAPLTCAFLKNKGYSVLDWLTIRPKKAITEREMAALRRASGLKARLLIVDESVQEGRTLMRTSWLFQQTGVSDSDVVVLNPVDAAYPNWRSSRGVQALSRMSFIALETCERHKQKLMESDRAARQLQEYFQALGYVGVRLTSSPVTEKWNQEWRTRPPVKVDTRLKRIYQVQLEDAAGSRETRHVLAKGVGWAWMSYHAFLVAERLKGFVSPLLGLRDGILYTEWFPQDGVKPAIESEQSAFAEHLGTYVAARARLLAVPDDPTKDLAKGGRHNGYELLSYWLSRAYASSVARAANLRKIAERLAAFAPPTAVLTDSKMSPEEWLRAGSQILKADFEQHAQGKNELMMTDPAFDLAGAIFYFRFGAAETEALLRAYSEATGDHAIEGRLFINKLLVGFYAKEEASRGLTHPELIRRRDEFNRLFLDASNFLVAETVRECSKLCRKPSETRWHEKLIVCDIDGVIDKLVFGFAGTTAAGIRAISMLHAHGYAMAVNTARNLDEVKLYCRSYGFAGGVGEYGSVLWDDVRGRQRVLVGEESMKELGQVRRALREIPGVYLNDDYKYSLRAFMYVGNETVPLPAQQMQDVLTQLGVQRLRAVRTSLDYAIVAKEADKGAGMAALLDFVGLPGADVIAIGDSEPDLAMFRRAHRSFSPGHIHCRQEARALGCWIAEKPLVAGFLQVAQKIAHPTGADCNVCASEVESRLRAAGLLSELLGAADQKSRQAFMRNMWKSSVMEMFKK